MYAAPGVVNVAPFDAAALAAPYPSCDDELEVSLILDTFLIQRADKLLFCGAFLRTCRDE